MKSLTPRVYVVSDIAVGSTSIGAKSGSDQRSPTMPVMQTVPGCLVERRESRSVVVPMSSSTLSAPPSHRSRTVSAMAPSSRKKRSAPAPALRTSTSPPARRDVAPTSAPCAFASAAAAGPTDVVPPRIRSRSPLFKRSALKRVPHVVCNISGKDPNRSQPRLVLIARTWVAGTTVYSA